MEIGPLATLQAIEPCDSRIVVASFLVASLVAVQLSGEMHCPDVSTVENRLDNLLPAASGRSGDQVLLSPAPGAINVELRRANGTLIARRTVLEKESCAETADAIAVTVAAWESEISAPTALPMAFPLATPAVSAPTSALFARRPPAASSLAWEVEASLLGSIAGNAFAFGAAGEVYLGRQGFPLGARIGLVGADTRALVLGNGRVSWGRAALTLGPSVEVVAKVIRLELHADFAAGWLFLRGQSFTMNYSDNAFDPALGGGVRASINRWSVSPWIDVTMLGWLVRQSALAVDSGIPVSVEIPRFDVWLRAGIAYGRRR